VAFGLQGHWVPGYLWNLTSCLSPQGFHPWWPCFSPHIGRAFPLSPWSHDLSSQCIWSPLPPTVYKEAFSFLILSALLSLQRTHLYLTLHYKWTCLTMDFLASSLGCKSQETWGFGSLFTAKPSKGTRWATFDRPNE
jgi:hypothetical protein